MAGEGVDRVEERGPAPRFETVTPRCTRHAEAGEVGQGEDAVLQRGEGCDFCIESVHGAPDRASPNLSRNPVLALFRAAMGAPKSAKTGTGGQVVAPRYRALLIARRRVSSKAMPPWALASNQRVPSLTWMGDRASR